MLRPENVATPETAVTVVTPERVAPKPPVPGVIPSETAPVKPTAVLPNASSAVTWMAGVIDAPAVVVVGGTVKASSVAAPAATAKGALVAPLSPLLVAESA